jgi:hypothetical protein
MRDLQIDEQRLVIDVVADVVLNGPHRAADDKSPQGASRVEPWYPLQPGVSALRLIFHGVPR